MSNDEMLKLREEAMKIWAEYQDQVEKAKPYLSAGADLREKWESIMKEIQNCCQGYEK